MTGRRRGERRANAVHRRRRRERRGRRRCLAVGATAQRRLIGSAVSLAHVETRHAGPRRPVPGGGGGRRAGVPAGCRTQQEHSESTGVQEAAEHRGLQCQACERACRHIRHHARDASARRARLRAVRGVRGGVGGGGAVAAHRRAQLPPCAGRLLWRRGKGKDGRRHRSSPRHFGHRSRQLGRERRPHGDWRERCEVRLPLVPVGAAHARQGQHGRPRMRDGPGLIHAA